MTSALVPVTWHDLVRSVAWEHGIEWVSPWDADYILWEHTGFPSFWRGNPVDSCIEQLQEFFGGLGDWTEGDVNG